jgi:hypothetical protein
MKKFQSVLLTLCLLLLSIVAWLAQPAPASAALSIDKVTPNAVATNTSARLSVTGSGFEVGTQVVLIGFGPLVTNYRSADEVEADLPAGLPQGSYTLRVENPDLSWYELPGALTILPAEATPLQEPTTTSTPSTSPAERPLIVVKSYNSGNEAIKPGQEFNLVIRLANVGQREAVNIVATFTPGDFQPRVSGGVLAMDTLSSSDERKFNQPLVASPDLFGKSTGTLVMTLNYTDNDGIAYTGTFNLTIRIVPPRYGPAATVTPTPTAAPRLRPQLVITGYNVNTDTLKPGRQFVLELKAQNMGNGLAKGVTMILGGGSSSSGGQSGTPEAGGVSGGSGEFTNFAPVAASNIQYLGDVAVGDNLTTSAALIVNTSTNPGAYPMKVSFSYITVDGTSYTDDQVITLLVYSPPVVDINFYRDPGPMFAGQPNQLPLQVINLGRKGNVLGNMRVTGVGAQFSNNTTLVGLLDTGNYFTMDATMIPDGPGSLDLQVTVDYTDDFNQPQVITKTISVEVLDVPVIEPPTDGGAGEGGIPPVSATETFWQKALRFVRGLIGLDSGQPASAPGGLPIEEPPGKTIPVPVPGPKG